MSSPEGHAEEAPAVRGGGAYRGGNVMFTRLYVSLAKYHSNQTEGRGEGQMTVPPMAGGAAQPAVRQLDLDERGPGARVLLAGGCPRCRGDCGHLRR